MYSMGGVQQSLGWKSFSPLLWHFLFVWKMKAFSFLNSDDSILTLYVRYGTLFQMPGLPFNSHVSISVNYFLFSLYIYRVRPVNPDNFEMPVSTPVMVVPDSARYH